MYNEEQKKRYIEKMDFTEKKVLIQLFNNVEQVEKMNNKDICNFVTPEILEWYKFLFTTSLDRLVNINAKLAKYQTWCLQQNLVNDSQNHFLEITPEVLTKCLNKIAINNGILTREQLINHLRKFENAQYKFVFLGAFEGIDSAGVEHEELIKATFKDINISDKTIKLVTGRTIKISDKLIQYAEEASNTYIYHAVMGDFDSEIIGDEIIKNRPRKNAGNSNTAKGKKLYRNFIRCRDAYGLSKFITLDKLRASGIIEYINDYAKENNITGEKAFYNNTFLKTLSKQYNIDKTDRPSFMKTYGSFLV